MSTYFFQIRIPADLAPGQQPCAPLRLRLGEMPKRDAQPRAGWLAMLAKAAFADRRRLLNGQWTDTTPPLDGPGFPPGGSPEEFLDNMAAFLNEAAAKLASPAPPPRFAPAEMRTLAAIQEAVAIEQEVRKGPAGHPTVTARADLLRQDVWNRWRAGEGLPPEGEAPLARVMDTFARIAERQLDLLACAEGRATHPSAPPMVDCPVEAPAAIPPIASPAPSASSPMAVSSAPLFSELAEEYLTIREAGGADRATISTARWRVSVFTTLVGDRPIDRYYPIDLQTYVNDLQHLPVELSREGDNTQVLREMGIHAAIAKNRAEACYEPIALKTMQDGYVQIVRTIISTAVGLRQLRDPFQGYRIRWPKDAKPSKKREPLDYERLNQVFKLGVDSGYLDDALLPPLCLLSTRRLGILPFIRGCDFGEKHGVDIVRVNGIVFDKAKGKYVRVGYKTDASLQYFVLHSLFRRIGFVDWAKTQGEGFIFRLLASAADPGDAASKRVNRLLRAAGAIGMNVEVGHSLRHGGKDLLIEENVDDLTTRLQMGHEAQDVHADYGRQSALRRGQCQELAHFDLPEEIDWTMFEGLDFEAMASRPRAVGRPKRKTA
ncbi:hypothetical protein [Blastochloris sulfoviridis]|uniref:Site-specific integrase n=1 Tax=Blastochloris sulfoviridis TaxID=50712 RepID=A0A5M6HIB1_9HYPH|nr:hypothetical protein [Blastochloris sulfoviridis]KAA5595505.1 hypothetical protein F1193_16520 [Blastochloris sulfoviridis]